MIHTTRVVRRVLAASLLCGATAFAQPPAQDAAASQDPNADVIKQGQQLLREGKLDEALALDRKTLATSPDSVSVNVQAGAVLDLLGQYAEARKYFEKAIDAAKVPQAKSQATRSMAISYGFQGDCKGAEKYEAPLFDANVASKAFFDAGEVANELARICLESGDVNQAEAWYRKGYEAGLNEPDIKPDRKDLWEFRWEHAQARIAARRGDQAAAQKHVEATKVVLDRGTNPTQAQFYPYLVGYVAFYGGRYQDALAELQKANQNDPFILSLIAQTYEKLGDQAHAMEYYRKILTFTAHNPTNAFARPLAKKKVG